MIVCLIGFLIVYVRGAFCWRRYLWTSCCVWYIYRLRRVQSLGGQVTLNGFDSGSRSATCSLRWLILLLRGSHYCIVLRGSCFGRSCLQAGLASGSPHAKYLLSATRDVSRCCPGRVRLWWLVTTAAIWLGSVGRHQGTVFLHSVLTLLLLLLALNWKE